MQWLLDNWVWVLFGGGMIGMHLFGHGKHGGGKSGGGCCGESAPVKPEATAIPPAADMTEKEKPRDR